MVVDLHHDVVRPFDRLSEPGSAPGTLRENPDEPKPVIRVLAYSNGTLLDTTLDSTETLGEIAARHVVTWINVDGLGDVGVIKQIGAIFGLHPLALEDVVNVHQRPNVEPYGEHLFVVAKMLSDASKLQLEQVGMFVGDRFVITFQEGIPGDCLEPVRRRLRESNGRIRERGPDYLAYALLDSIIDHYFPVVESYGERLDALDDLLIRSNGSASIAEIHRFRSQLLVLRRAVRPHREMLNALMHDSGGVMGDDVHVYLRDCYDHVIQLGEAIDTYRETCSDLRDYQLAATSNRSNEAMQTLTLVATVFIPLSFIAGVYGMNFEHIPETDWPYGYAYALGLMAAVAGGLVWWFHRRGWFDR